ncbi:GNAT family N-acetyltransferase [Alicyclobacillus tolerans]|uniref:RimJ/RimL family protein N-acetyltransferase n=1 Tax=Alicyclobacillus tolerans TaxID=90970 RepID=A0ABT9LXF3_9BACL|nr:GNAT family N-acetyltransferase [Alicyclobacillus tengchongensis]MDP9728942.1 RimJ/RimL family protein N-acetyltransferase [Alicyclobacillus tengchongensis]
MVSWNQELVLAAMEDKSRLSQILGLEVPHDFPSDSVRKFVLPMTLEELERDPSIGQWSGMIVHVSDAILIGTMGFKSSPDEFGNVEMGYDIIPKYQGQGYATEMAWALIEWAFRQPSVDCITAKCLVTNIPSVRVLEKVRMKKVSQVEDMIYWKIDKR